jgi:hypothetical protein
MKVAFTLCSLNYMAQAKTLADSFHEYNPEWHFVIGLVDRVNGRLPESYWHPYELIEVEKINIEGFEEMCKIYDIVELNTAVKPSYIKYFFKRYKDLELVAYFDPDIMFFGKLEDLENKVGCYDVFLTPHFFKPINEEQYIPLEILCLSVGVFNLGFIAFSNSKKSIDFIEWWRNRLRKYCFRNGKGLFVDQIWANYIPVFFEKFYFLHEGHNVAYWNLQERFLSKEGDRFYVNKTQPLIFFHFSSYNPNQPQIPFRYWDSLFNFENRPDILEIHNIYRNKLLLNDYNKISSLDCVFTYNPIKEEAWVRHMRSLVYALKNFIPKKVRSKIKQILT